MVTVLPQSGLPGGVRVDRAALAPPLSSPGPRRSSNGAARAGCESPDLPSPLLSSFGLPVPCGPGLLSRLASSPCRSRFVDCVAYLGCFVPDLERTLSSTRWHSSCKGLGCSLSWQGAQKQAAPPQSRAPTSPARPRLPPRPSSVPPRPLAAPLVSLACPLVPPAPCVGPQAARRGTVGDGRGRSGTEGDGGGAVEGMRGAVGGERAEEGRAVASSVASNEIQDSPKGPSRPLQPLAGRYPHPLEDSEG